MGVMNDMLCLYGPSLLASSYHSAVERHVSTLGGMTRHNIYSGAVVVQMSLLNVMICLSWPSLLGYSYYFAIYYFFTDESMNDMLCLSGPLLLVSTFCYGTCDVSTLGGMTRHNIYIFQVLECKQLQGIF